MGGVTAVQPLFAGGQIVNGNKLAGLGVDVSKLQLEKSENDVELTAEQYFWQLVALNENSTRCTWPTPCSRAFIVM